LRPTTIDELLWGISVAGQLLLLGVLVKRRLYSAFPLFCVYIAYASVSDGGFLILYSQLSQIMAFRMFFLNQTIEFLLQIGILLEVGRNVFNPVKRSLPRASIYILGGILAAAAGITLLISKQSQVSNLDRWVQYFVYVNFAVAVLRLAIFTGIAGFSQFLGIGWRNHVLQIATGFLAYSIVVLVVELLHRHTGIASPLIYHIHEQFRIVSWCMVLGYWSYALSRVEASRKEFSPKMAEFLVSLSGIARSKRR